MQVNPIRTKKDYQAALKEVEKLFDAKPKTARGDRLDVLTTLIEAYEEKHHKIDFPDPIDAINYWIESLSNTLQQGLILLIDYGFPQREYYHPDRSMGTVMCHYQHRAHTDPLILTGQQDITAHVDFTAVAEAAIKNNLEVDGYTNQAAFLINCGITELLEKTEDTATRFNWSNQVKKLTLPSEMGELFKVIALTKNVDDELLGFQMMDQLERL